MTDIERLEAKVDDLAATVRELAARLGMTLPEPSPKPEPITPPLLHAPEAIATELGWGPNKPYLVAKANGWLGDDYIHEVLKTPGIGQKPTYTLMFTEALRRKLLEHKRKEVRPVPLTCLQTDVLIAAERLGIQDHPVWLDGTSLAEAGYPHGNRSMDRTVNELVSLGVLTVLEKPAKRRGKYVQRTPQPVTKHPSAALVRDAARRAPEVRRLRA